jgi:hypothetical protein
MFSTRISRSLLQIVKRRNFSAIADKRKKFYDNNTAVGKYVIFIVTFIFIKSLFSL